MMKYTNLIYAFLLVGLAGTACSDDDALVKPEPSPIVVPELPEFPELNVESESFDLKKETSKSLQITSGAGEYRVNVLDPGIASATVEGNLLTVTGLVVGKTEVVVSDKGGSYVSLKLNVYNSDVVTLDTEHIDLTVKMGAPATTTFRITDGNPAYRVSSSAPEIATAEIGEDGATTLMKLDTCVFPLIGALLMVAFGILKPKEAYVSIGMGGMVLTYVGVLALASGLTNTGTGALIGNAIASLFGQNANGYLIGLVFFLVPFVLTQFMMNWAVLNMFAPIAILTCTAIGANPSGPLDLVATGALTACMSPLATPSVAMFMGIGGYDQKTMFKMGWLPALILCIVNVLWVMTIYPL